ncbi:phospholipase A [Haliea sp. E17]|uniref:phospholipase A n=1 Tax=Haliea sp. E17 TaxID=3401576 RepID=UPI003AAAF379
MMTMESLIKRGALGIALLAAPLGSIAAGQANSGVDACLLEALKTASEATTVGELRKNCEIQAGPPAGNMAERPVKPALAYEQNAIEARFAEETGIEERPYAITPYRPNFLIWTHMDQPNQAPFEEVTGVDDPVQNNEMEFQVSIKAPVWRNMFGSNIDTYLSYTTRSYWQLFNDDLSAPFRETNYEPEVYIRSYTSYALAGARLDGWSLGFNHQSNGRGEPTSRSWNRIMGSAVIGVGNDLGFLLRAWYRIPEDEEDDDNPGMYKYLGYGDLRAVWAPNRNTFTAMIRPGTRDTGYELTWSYPINRVFRVYAQYYNGPGESLIDYDQDIERIGIGVALNDYLQRF